MSLETFRNLIKGVRPGRSGAGDPEVELATAGNGSGDTRLRTGKSLESDEVIRGVNLPLREIGFSPYIEDILREGYVSRSAIVGNNGQRRELEVIIPQAFVEESVSLGNGDLDRCAQEICDLARDGQMLGPIVMTNCSQNGSLQARFEVVIRHGEGPTPKLTRAGLCAEVVKDTRELRIKPSRGGFWYADGVSEWPEPRR